MVAYKEAQELMEKGFLTSSCCPAFVRYIETQFPDMVKHISHNLSPMAEIAKYIKQTDPDSKIIFIGPCTAKKEGNPQRIQSRDYVDNVITFEELLTLFDSREIEVGEQEEDVLDNASYYGRIFARSGGVSDAVKQALKELGVPEEQFKANPAPCSGIENCRSRS